MCAAHVGRDREIEMLISSAREHLSAGDFKVGSTPSRWRYPHGSGVCAGDAFRAATGAGSGGCTGAAGPASFIGAGTCCGESSSHPGQLGERLTSIGHRILPAGVPGQAGGRQG